ncbi:putative Fe-S oxidoreductase [Synechococcus sp. PCC 7502]|uniref:YkgJ family cysteine cluster protein n=1 Tax=Synechococcus sp. PCC 7502 TaxID=1173263 RepID=UPI00029FB051|nr:YkgJ family cysteine cluster protein [Synechococcus sp. PCC 7502]AFY74220.1 putative Fe-S oxidoreductase [Synechococcus sp. PCC 7502]
MLELIDQINKIYRAIDQQIEVLQQASGLQCPSGCGKCCENPQVETTVLEVLPLALELVQRDEAEYWLEQAAHANHSGVCIFYQPDHLVAGNGRCGVYAWRPSLCRLFGFASITNKHGQSELAACKIHKQTMPEVLATLPIELAPNFSDYSMQLRNLNPDQSDLLPINTAMAIAINKVGLLRDYQDY